MLPLLRRRSPCAAARCFRAMLHCYIVAMRRYATCWREARVDVIVDVVATPYAAELL